MDLQGYHPQAPSPLRSLVFVGRYLTGTLYNVVQPSCRLSKVQVELAAEGGKRVVLNLCQGRQDGYGGDATSSAHAGLQALWSLRGWGGAFKMSSRLGFAG